jgi:hypothetical protein
MSSDLPEAERLSLATFEADRAFPPYLNTPRSIEACRRTGINPIELVEIPVTEFQKDFPNDPDGAQRRFERFDAARRRVLAQALSEWKVLVEKNWQPSKIRPKSAKETILVVPPDTHSSMLELQAAMFRKVEKDNYDRLQRMLKIELKQAAQELENKRILQKHDEIQNANDEGRKILQEKRARLEKEKIELQKQKDDENLREIRRLQELDAVYAQELKEKEIQRRKLEKERNEQRELERVQRENYTRQMKETIVKGINDQIDSKKRILELRDKNVQERLDQETAERNRRNKERQEQEQARLEKIRLETLRRDEEERELVIISFLYYFTEVRYCCISVFRFTFCNSNPSE